MRTSPRRRLLALTFCLLAASACGSDDVPAAGPGGADTSDTGGADTSAVADSAATEDTAKGADTTASTDTGPAKDAGPGGCATSADCVDFAATLGPCRKGICDTSTNTCVEAFAADGSTCTDGDACTESDTCKGGTCAGKAKTCDDGDACTEDTCDAKTGKCGVSGKDLCACQADKDCASEEDGDLCNGTLFCDKSQDPPKCVVNPTTVVSCDTASDTSCLKTACNAKNGQCVPKPVADGAKCDDGSVCSSGDTCLKGSCAGGVIQTCDDNNPCTADTCDPSKGCVHTPNTLPCDDGDACSLGDKCQGGQCKGTATKACDDSNPCTNDECITGKGCVSLPNKATCDDGNKCTDNDACQGGQCTGGKSSCGCEADADCGKFDDGDACNGTLFCDKTGFPFVCKVDPKSVVSCDPSKDTACLKSQCDTKTGACGLQAVADKTPCDDGDKCTVNDACAKGLCTSAEKPNCNDGNPCTTDACDKTKGCVSTPAALPCDDGNACTISDVCSAGACKGGAPLNCNDGNACTKSACVPATGCKNTPVTGGCSDGNNCTTADKCDGGQCKGGALVDCDDKNDCTLDKCDVIQGCQHSNTTQPCEDGNACTILDKCAGGACKPGPKKNCNDGELCTDDFCDPSDTSSPCKHTPNAAPCNDGSACTIGDACFGGKCQGGGKLQCNDKNDCTDDSCDGKSGCVNLPNKATCDDSNPCTEGEGCAAGKCKASKSKSCDDGNACTFDSCDPLKDCQHTPNNAPCDDGDVCTDKDVCKGGKCTAGADVPFCCKSAAQCNDGSACTKDACQNNVCVNTPTGEMVFSETFDGSLTKWSFSTDNQSVAWQQVSDKVATPKGKSLYAGNQAKKSYNFGETEAIATLPKLQLPTGTLTLGMHVWIDTEDNDCDFDVLEVRVDGDELETICPSTKGWKYVQVDLSAFQGRAVTLSLAFVTGDNVSNNAEGIYIDNLTIRAGSCGDVACKADKDCQDLNLCTGDRCIEGKCVSSPAPSHTLRHEDFDDMPIGNNYAAQGWVAYSTNSKTRFIVHDKRARSGKQSLYGGSVATGGYDLGSSKWTAKLPKQRIPATGLTTMVLYVWADVQDQGCDKDRLRIIGPGSKVVATHCTSTGGKWQMVSADLSPWASKDIQMILEFDTVGSSNNKGEGIYIDDVSYFHTRVCEDPDESFENNDHFNFNVSSSNTSVYWHVTTYKKWHGVRSLAVTHPSTHKYSYGPVDAKAVTGFPVCQGGKLSFRVYAHLQDKNCNDQFTVTIAGQQVYKRCTSNSGFDLVTLDMAKWGNLSVPMELRFVADEMNNNGLGVYFDNLVMDCP